jgi:hypothetical protein
MTPPRSLVADRRFRFACCLHYHGDKFVTFWVLMQCRSVCCCKRLGQGFSTGVPVDVARGSARDRD